MSRRNPIAGTRMHRARRLVLAVAFAALAGCVTVDYAQPGRLIEARADRVLLVGRIRFFYDDREYFPWHPGDVSGFQRHVWLLRLDHRKVSPELRPDADGALAMWLEPGDYAVVGSPRSLRGNYTMAREVIALVRAPTGAAVAYAGDLVLSTYGKEGGQVHFGEFGEARVIIAPAPAARAALEERYGALPEPPVASPWCAGQWLPAFEDPRLVEKARALLDSRCTIVP